MSLNRALIIPDCHRPFHSRKAYQLMISVARDINPKEIVLLGDYADFYSVSRHSKDVSVNTLLKEEIDSVNEGLDELDALFPNARKIFLQGNHEIRLEHYISEKAPALFGVTECKNLFNMGKRKNWGFVPYGRYQVHKILGTELYARHRALAANPTTGLQRAGVSYCHGDCHRILEAQMMGLDWKKRIVFSPGWLGDPRLKAFDYMTEPPQWAWGFAVVSAGHDKKTYFHHEIIRIHEDFTCLYNGKLYSLGGK